MSGLPSLTILSEEQKFNGDNLLQWKTNLTQLLGSKGLMGYVDGKIPKPDTRITQPAGSSTSETTQITVTTTPIYSTTPTADEWDFRDQLARGHITLNCTDTMSLGVKTDGTAKEAWDSIQDEWGKSTDMRRSHAQEALNQTIFVEGTDIQEHIKLLRTRKAAVDNLSTTAMSGETWRGVIIRSIPPTTKWLPVIPSLYSMSSSADVISTLLAHGMILGRESKPKGTSTSSTALSARTTEGCTNPNCKAKKRSTHTTNNCYWPGGGKEGQFPPNFGQRSKANIATADTTPSGSSTMVSNTTTSGQSNHFVLSARIPSNSRLSGILIDGLVPEQSGTSTDDLTNVPHTALISKAFQTLGKGKVLTFMDSGASDTMFVSKDDFSEYHPIVPRTGDSAKAVEGHFEIVGEGNVVQRYKVDGKEREITYTRALHAPTLNANLVSIGALDKAGITTTFGGGRGIARTSNGTVILDGTNVNGMYILETVDTVPHQTIAMKSSAQPTSLEQWHRRLTHCSPLTIKEMVNENLVDGLKISQSTLTGKCEDCILGRQTRRAFDGTTEKDLSPLELVSFDLWGPSRVQSVGGKLYLMIIVDAGTSYKYGAYLSDKSDTTTLGAFEIFRAKVETMTGKKIRRLRTDGAFDTVTWRDYLQKQGITQEMTAPYSSSQNGLAERAIRTTMEDVRTLLRDSDLGHSYWAEAAAHSIYTRNLIPSRRHPKRIPLESLTGRRQDIAHLRVFGAKCWAKIPTVHGVQVTGGSKLDVRSTECRLLGYAPGSGNYKVQDITTRRVFVSRDVIFEEGLPRRTSANVGENTIPIFDANINDKPPTEVGINDKPPTEVDNPHRNDPDPNISDHHTVETTDQTADQITQGNQNIANRPTEPRRSSRMPHPSQARLESTEYKARETAGKGDGQDWATDRSRPQANYVIGPDTNTDHHENILACLTESKASHRIPQSYKHAMATEPERWMIPMKVEMDTLKAKHTWDLVIPPPGANIMGSMWVYDIKWDGEGKRIKDKARLVGKGYTQQLGVDYNETWAGVTRLESVRMSAAIAASLDLKLWRIDFVGAYLNSLTKEDIYMKQPEGFVEPGKENHACKLVHTIYGTMQGGHDWFETLGATYDKLGYTTSRADPCVRFKRDNGNYTLTDTYTDDVFGASNNEEEARRRKDEMGKIWDIKDVGENEYFLGMRVQQDLHLGTIRLTQRPYWEHVINRFQLDNVTPRNTPLPVGISLDNTMCPQTDSEKRDMATKPYRPILGSVMWGQLATRPDLSFSVSLLARFQSNPGINHWSALMHVIGYIKNTLDYGLTYSRDADLSPTAFSDADYGGCRDTR